VGQADIGGGLRAVCFAEWSQGKKGGGAEAKMPLSGRGGKTPVFGVKGVAATGGIHAGIMGGHEA